MRRLNRCAAVRSPLESTVCSGQRLPFDGKISYAIIEGSECTATLVAIQYRHRSSKYGVKGEEDRSLERERNSKNKTPYSANSSDAKKEDLYEFTNLMNVASNSKSVPLGMGSQTEGDRKVMTINPMMLLRKADDSSKGNKIVKAISKIQGKPDSMRLTEEQQSDLVNAYAETRWYAPFWRPFSNINYARARRYRLFANIGLCFCIVFGFTAMFSVYYQEMLVFCELEEAEQIEYRHVIMNVPIGMIKEAGDRVLKRYDPNEILTPIERIRILLEEMRRLGWNTKDWEVEKRQFKPWYETMDYWHAFFWSSMWIGKIVSGGGSYYSPKQAFGKIQQQATRRREESNRRQNFAGDASPLSEAASPSNTTGGWLASK